MKTSVSPLPVPLWPMLALSLTLFCVTTLAATVAAHRSGQNYANSAQFLPEIAVAAPSEEEIARPLTSRFFAQYRAD